LLQNIPVQAARANQPKQFTTICNDCRLKALLGFFTVLKWQVMIICPRNHMTTCGLKNKKEQFIHYVLQLQSIYTKQKLSPAWPDCNTFQASDNLTILNCRQHIIY